MAGNISKNHIEKTFLKFFAEGHVCEFYLADNSNTLTGFPSLAREEKKKLKDVAVSLVRAGFLEGNIIKSSAGTADGVTICNITPDGVEYLKTL